LFVPFDELTVHTEYLEILGVPVSLDPSVQIDTFEHLSMCISAAVDVIDGQCPGVVEPAKDTTGTVGAVVLEHPLLGPRVGLATPDDVGVVFPFPFGGVVPFLSCPCFLAPGIFAVVTPRLQPVFGAPVLGELRYGLLDVAFSANLGVHGYLLPLRVAGYPFPVKPPSDGEC
jgi:hypothetical protein